MPARPPAWPVAASLGLHLAVAAALATTALRRLPLPAEPVAISLMVAPEPAAPPASPTPPADMPLTGTADLQEATPGPVAWPERPTPPRPAPAPRQSASAPASSGPAISALAPAHPAATPSEIAAWQAALSAWVERHRRYPPAARFRQEEGVVRVRFVLDAAGRVREAALETPSGSPALDGAALALLAGATLPAPPPGMDPALRSVSLPIRYRLE